MTGRKENYMNNPRRAELRKALALLEEASEIIQLAAEEEQDCFDNLPEGLQESERGQIMDENVSRLEDIANELDSQAGELEDIIEG